MSLLRQKSAEGGRAALAAFGLPAQPGLGSVGIKAPTTSPGLPNAPKVPSIPKPTTASPSPTGSMGMEAGKVAFNVGMGASTSTDGSGAQAGEPVDTGRRQRSVIDRALQRNDDDYATSSMPMPGAVVSP
jgi:hypothetical protein